MSEEFMLTTVDNPYNPFTHFNEWYAFDIAKGYHTCSYLARISETSNELSTPLINEDLYAAMDEIIKLQPLMYRKVTKDTKISPISIEKVLANLQT
jgi:hypothetical protein